MVPESRYILCRSWVFLACPVVVFQLLSQALSHDQICAALSLSPGQAWWRLSCTDLRVCTESWPPVLCQYLSTQFWPPIAPWGWAHRKSSETLHIVGLCSVLLTANLSGYKHPWVLFTVLVTPFSSSVRRWCWGVWWQLDCPSFISHVVFSHRCPKILLLE